MVERAREHAERTGFAGKVSFLVADAQHLPFKGATFDTVISESVTAFVKKKEMAIGEYMRVLTPGGYLGLNEVTWRREPSRKVKSFTIEAIGGVEPESAEGWKRLLLDAGFHDVAAIPQKFNPLIQAIHEVRQIGLVTGVRAWCRFSLLMVTNPAFRRAARKMIRDTYMFPMDLFRFFGYAIYCGKK
jgi:ubiquinone/menaquinone biosynthesis C-methylase UbiE